jgi:DNA-binding PadR family transcriptional regulator
MLKEPTYGYSLISRITDTGIAIEGNTLYPLLRRLEEQGLLESTWNTDGAKPRKYYSATAFGSEILTELKQQWDGVSASMNRLLEGIT